MIALDTGVVSVPALGRNGPFTAHNRHSLRDVAGTEVAKLSLVPSVFVQRTMTALRQAPTPSREVRFEWLARAGELFANGVPDGLSREQYEGLVSRVGGVPIAAVQATTTAIADRLRMIGRTVENARPAGALDDWRDPRTRSGHALWRRRGNVFAVQAAGNHPGAHSIWPEALALGYRVAVRPSRREPFTPLRLVSALRAAGFGDDHIAFLPTEHDLAGRMLRAADAGMVYGGADVIAEYAHDSRVLVQGPGRSKILITRDRDWREYLNTIVDSISHHGGTGCVNTTAVLIEGDPSPLCDALAQRLAALPSLPPEHPKAVLPVQPAATAHAIGAYLARHSVGAKPWLGGDGVVDELEDGSAVLRPAVHELADAGAPQLGLELPLPCVWVAPWSREAGSAPLRDSLVLTAITGDGALVDQLLDEPTIRNVYLGHQRTYRIEPGLPHDGYLAEFLMRSKSVIRD
jgi:acyl-CoA reductase-like NAD-dependent aldehyde dehydrogenase